MISAQIERLKKDSRELEYSAIRRRNQGRTDLMHKILERKTYLDEHIAEIMEVVKKVHIACYASGTETMMTYIKIQSAADKDVTIEDKIKKYT